MEAKPLTKEALALTEKKMDMALDDIIKMSKNNGSKGKKTRASNKSQRTFSNASQDKSMRVQRFMNSRSSLRQGVLAQKRSNFHGNQFPLAKEAARKAAAAPFRARAPPRDKMAYSNKARSRPSLAMNRSSNNRNGAPKQQQNDEGNKQRPQTLDARFANLKEQRMKAGTSSHSDNIATRRNGGGGRKQIPPWTRFPK